MADFENEHPRDKSLEQLVESLRDVAEPGSPTWHMIRGAIDVKVAEIQRDAAHEALSWAKLVAISTAIATVIAPSRISRLDSLRLIRIQIIGGF